MFGYGRCINEEIREARPDPFYVIKQTDQEGKTRTFVYAATGRLTTITDGIGNAIGIDVASALPASITFPTFTRSLTYDKRGRVTQTSDKLDVNNAQISKVAYDGVGNRISTTNPAGRTTQYTYDKLNRLHTVTDPSGGITTYTYDVFDQLLSVKDANGSLAFRYQYDAAGRMVKELRPMGQFASYVYDGEGNLNTMTDANAKTIAYTYDAAGKVVSIQYPAANGLPAKSVSFTYDGNGNLLTYNDGTTSGSYTYDANNRKISESVNYGAFTLSSAYTYYKNGKKKSFTGADGKTITYTYDAGDRLSLIGIPGQGSMVYNSYKWLAPTKITLPGGGSKNYIYDALLRPTTIHMKDPAQNTLMRYTYAYDAAGNITVKNTEHGNYAYGYDVQDRLTSATYPTSSEAFTYDKVGNRTKHNNSSPWQYNANNELTARPSITYQYDANGSQIKKTENGITTDYIYNGENRLTQVKQGAIIIASYKHDPFGRRISKTVNGATTYYGYSDEGLIAEADSTGTVKVSYGYAPDSVWGTDPFYMRVNGTYHYYFNDHLGTPQQLALKNGAKTWAAVYEAFGKATVTTSAITNNLRFPGQYADSETGLHYNWNRTYDNQIGRHINMDRFYTISTLVLLIVVGMLLAEDKTEEKAEKESLAKIFSTQLEDSARKLNPITRVLRLA